MHTPPTTARFGLVLLSLALPAAPAEPAEPSAELPRYRLQVGQELAYRGQSEFQHEHGKFLDRSTWRIWVIRANPDGSWRLVIRNGSVFSQEAAKAPAQGLTDFLKDVIESAVSQGAAKRLAQPEQVTFAYTDLFPDGRLVANDSFGFHMQPQTVLPRLPQDEAEAAKGWAGKDERLDETTRYRLLSQLAGAPRCTLEAVRESPMNVIYGFAFKDLITFDTRRGLVEQVESENRQTYGFKGRGHGTTRLEGIKTHDAAWCAAFAADADRYFAAQHAYEQATEQKTKTAAAMKAVLEQAAASLRAARKELKLPAFQKQVDDLLSRHEGNASSYLEEAANREAVLGKPAADWSTTDLEGKKHALKDYRGKVVVLDFWYRGCGWCMRAMPQVKQVAAHFRGRPVVVFGMNTDPKEEDAKFVVGKMGLTYPTLKATGLPEKYKVRGFPTLVIIDQEGVVRDVHVGYSPTLEKEAVKAIEDLLRRRS